MTDAISTTTAVVRSPARLEMATQRADDSQLRRSARSLADAAQAFRQSSDARHEREELAHAFERVDAALADLAAGAELIAYGTMDRSRRRRDGPADELPLATARALSWRLHGLRASLMSARGISSELAGVLDGAAHPKREVP
jgi:hypothetical protein